MNNTSCLITQLPDICAGAQGSANNTSGGLHESGVVTYTHSAAIYAIGKLNTRIPSYNPAWKTLSPYGFTSAVVDAAWLPLVHTVSNGMAVTGGGIATSGGVCAPDSYDTEDKVYTLVSWDNLLNDSTLAAVGGGWIGAGGFCSCSVTSCSSGFVPPGAGITSPPSAVTTLLATVTVPTTPSSPTGGGGSSGGGACDMFIGVVTRAPTGGFGVGTVASAVFSTDGSYRTSGASISVVFPYLS